MTTQLASLSLVVVEEEEADTIRLEEVVVVLLARMVYAALLLQFVHLVKEGAKPMEGRVSVERDTLAHLVLSCLEVMVQGKGGEEGVMATTVGLEDLEMEEGEEAAL